VKDSRKINNLADLRAEIARLRLRKVEQETYLAGQFSLLRDTVGRPLRFASAVVSGIPGTDAVKAVFSGIAKAARGKDSDWLTKILQIATPFALNATLSKNVGKMKKALLFLVSEVAIGQVNAQKANRFIRKMAKVIRPKK